MAVLSQLFKQNMRQYGMIIALIVITIFFQILTEGILLKPLNVTNIILQNSYILVLAIGMLLVIITGHIDLSVGSVAAFVGAIAGVMMVQWGFPVYITVIMALFIGALVGAWNGFWIAYMKIPSFIVTLAGMLLFRGLTMIILDGKSIAPFPNAFQKMSSGFLPDFMSDSPVNQLTLLFGFGLSIIYVFQEWRNRRLQVSYKFDVLPISMFIVKIITVITIIIFFSIILSRHEGIPNILLILFALIVIYTFIMNKTVIGRRIYATGGNEKAAKLSGIATHRVTFWVFVNMGMLAALSGLLFAARLNAATPKAGINFELDAIAAVFIGGASAAGGIGNVIGAIIGGLVMGVMNNGMSLVNLGIDWQLGIKGIVLLLAVGFDIYTKSRNG